MADGVGAVAVCEGTRLVGIFTERDVLRLAAERADFRELRVAEVMTTRPVTATPDVLLVDAGNQRVRRVDQTTGLVSTVAGTGIPGWNGDGLPSVNTHWNGPTHAWLDGSTPANLFLADAANRRVRRFVP